MSLPLEHYGLIGSSTTVALVSRRGSVDWLCAPRIDSDACFAKLLGNETHGYWAIRPAAEVLAVRQRYQPDTLILETEFTCRDGRVRLIDFMPPHGGVEPGIVRIVEGLEGDVSMYADLKVRFAYGRLTPWIQCHGRGATLVSGPDALEYSTTVAYEPDWDASRVESSFVVRAGQRLPFRLQYHRSYQPAHDEELDAEQELVRAQGYWRDWAGRCRYEGPFRDAVVRSLITLKALTHDPTGGIVAAPTTSLPEEIGGVRNWDYRFGWLRDSALTLDVLILGGYVDEARAWRDWLLRAIAGAPQDAQIMYSVAGEHRLTEVELPWLPGYEDSRPVRIGNAASDQFQLDVYGEVLNLTYEARTFGVARDLSVQWDTIEVLVDFVERNWSRPDDGIWEVRGGRRHFTHSKMMTWVAMDRGVKIIEMFAQNAPPRLLKRLVRWRAVREEIRAEILTRAFNEQLGAFTQSYGSTALDASVLLMPHMGFLPASDPRVRSTVDAIQQRLTKNGFVERYSTEAGIDGLPGHEATFLICSFWLVDNLAMSGRLEEAETLFERLLSLRSELGLLAEEYDTQRQRLIGNFPQAFSHVGLTYSAFLIEAARAGRDVAAADSIPIAAMMH